MRQFIIDELSREEQANIDSYLKRTATPGSIAGMYFLPLPQDLHGKAQLGHEACGPFSFAIELTDQGVTFELLVRSRSNLHCSCISYASDAQRAFLLSFIDRLLEEEKIKA